MRGNKTSDAKHFQVISRVVANCSDVDRKCHENEILYDYPKTKKNTSKGHNSCERVKMKNRQKADNCECTYVYKT